MSFIVFRLTKTKTNSSVFGVARLESHASLLLQILDILLGSVLYEFKKEAGLISEKLAQKQRIVVDQLKAMLKTDTLTTNKTIHEPNYFSIWKFRK